MPVLLVMVLSRLCNIKLPKWLTAVIVVYPTIVLGLVMTIGYSGIYYKSVRLAEGNGYHYLVKEYGPAHNLYTIMMLFFTVILICMIVGAFYKRNSVSFRTVLTASSLGIITIMSYVLTRVLDSPFEWVSVGYLIGVIIITRLFERINMFDMTTNVAISIEQMKEYGYLTFSVNKRFVGANNFLTELFPEIKSWKIEEVVPETDSQFYREVILWFYDCCDRNGMIKTIHVNDLYLDFSVRDIVYGKRNKKVGYLVEAIDRTSEHNYTATIEKYNTELELKVAEKTEHINHIKDLMVLGMASMVESRDNSTGGHIRRTSDVVRVFSEELKQHASELHFSENFLQMVIKAAPMHDLGKIAVDDVILRKNGKFTDEEYDQMKRHSAEGAKIVRSILFGVEEPEFVDIAENIAHYHHEKWNGQGYPCGIEGTAIPVEARIMALADVFDALVSKRCYKEAFTYDKAFSIIEESLGSHFDPVLGRIFLDCRPALESLYDGLQDD